MAVELIERRWCDLHLLTDGTKVEAGSKPSKVGIEGVTTKGLVEVDLCEQCDDQMLAPLRDMLNRKIRPAARADKNPYIKGRGTQAPEAHTEFCIICPPTRGFASDSGLRAHLADEHSIATSELLGSRCPLCDTEVTTLRAFHRHVDEHPGVTSASDAFRKALMMTPPDPFGVVKKALDRAK